MKVSLIIQVIGVAALTLLGAAVGLGYILGFWALLVGPLILWCAYMGFELGRGEVC